MPEETEAYTRAQLAQAAGVPPNVVQHWERQGLLAPSVHQAKAGEGRPNLYSLVDVAIAAFIGQARSLGLGRPAIAPIVAALAADPHLVPGWSGWVVVTAGGQVRLNTDLELLLEVLAARGTPAALIGRIDATAQTIEEAS